MSVRFFIGAEPFKHTTITSHRRTVPIDLFTPRGAATARAITSANERPRCTVRARYPSQPFRYSRRYVARQAHIAAPLKRA